MGIIRAVAVLLILIFILTFVLYPEETRALVKTVGNLILDFGKDRANDIQGGLAETISEKIDG